LFTNTQVNTKSQTQAKLETTSDVPTRNVIGLHNLTSFIEFILVLLDKTVTAKLSLALLFLPLLTLYRTCPILAV